MAYFTAQAEQNFVVQGTVQGIKWAELLKCKMGMR